MPQSDYFQDELGSRTKSDLCATYLFLQPISTRLSAIMPRAEFLRRNRTKCVVPSRLYLLIESPLVVVVRPSQVHRCHQHIREDDMRGRFGRRHATACEIL